MADDFVSSAAVAMGADKDLPDIELAIHHSVSSLCKIARDFLSKGIELTRICKLAVLLKESGVNPNIILYRKIAENCSNMQRNDGGWSDVVETMWCTTFLNLFVEYSDPVKKAFKWLKSQRYKDGGWGKSIRDPARIPITALLLYLLPQISSNEELKWLENKWNEERKFEPCLTYKAAFTLMAFSKNGYHPENQVLISETVRWLIGQQNNDGGWSPWKDHPVGSDPWCTGISMVGLLHYPEKIPQKVLMKALTWLSEKQLPNGLWPYHYIEEGSSWALYALVMGHSLLNGIKQEKDIE